MLPRMRLRAWPRSLGIETRFGSTRKIDTYTYIHIRVAVCVYTYTYVYVERGPAATSAPTCPHSRGRLASRRAGNIHRYRYIDIYIDI